MSRAFKLPEMNWWADQGRALINSTIEKDDQDQAGEEEAGMSSILGHDPVEGDPEHPHEQFRFQVFGVFQKRQVCHAASLHIQKAAFTASRLHTPVQCDRKILSRPAGRRWKVHHIVTKG